jgi:hypothetical protein
MRSILSVVLSDSVDGRIIFSPTREINRLLWTFIIYYSVRKSPPLILVVSQFNPVHALLKILLHIILQLYLSLQSGLFFSSCCTELIHII